VSLFDEVRTYCASVAASASWVRIDVGEAVVEPGVAGLDPDVYLLDAGPDDVARYVLVMDTVNFGSGWFPALATSTDAISRRLTEHARTRGGATWTPGELRSLAGAEVGEVLDLDPAHELIRLYTRALNDLGSFLGDRSVASIVSGSADRFARELTGMPFFNDHGFYKRAQITANDLLLAGVATFPDIDDLTIFADNLVPHVLRVDGVLDYDPALAAAVDAGELLEVGGPFEREIRACAVHACELLAARAGVPPRTLDNWLWNRGHEPRYRELPPHLTRTVFY
jgi:hypothetical protein